MENYQNITPEAFASWTNTATPEQLIQVSKSLVGKIDQLDTPYQEQFARNVRNAPTISKVLDRQTA